MNILCWWFGCTPGKLKYISNNDYIRYCKKCGNESDYHDLIGESKHRIFMKFVIFWGYRKWFPEKCEYCGKRYGDHKKCLPF